MKYLGIYYSQTIYEKLKFAKLPFLCYTDSVSIPITYTNACLAGDLTAYSDEWLFETKCGEVVCCALGGTDKYSMPYIVYETPTAYVLIIPNNPSAYSLQAIAWNMDFTQFR